MKPPSLAATLLLVAYASPGDPPILRQTLSLPPATTVRFTAVSPTGKLVAAICSDNRIRLWDVATGSLKTTLDLNGERPTVAQFSRGGELLAGGSERGTLRLWDTSGTLQHEYKLPAEVATVAISPDLSTMAVAPLELPLEVRAVAGGKLLASFPATFGGSAALAFSPDGHWLASADSDTEIRIIDARTLTLHARVTDLLLEPLAITFSPDGTRVIAGGADGIVTLIDSGSGKIVKSFPRQSDVLYILCASRDGKSIAGAYFNPDQISAPARILIWDAQTGSLRSSVPPADSGFNGGDYAQDGTLLLTSSTEKELKIWSTH